MRQASINIGFPAAQQALSPPPQSRPPRLPPPRPSSVFGTLLGLVFWGVHALVVRSLKGRRAALRMLTWRTYYQPRVIMTIVLVMFYLYPQVRRQSELK